MFRMKAVLLLAVVLLAVGTAGAGRPTKSPRKDETTRSPRKDETTKSPRKDETTRSPRKDQTTKSPRKDETTKSPRSRSKDQPERRRRSRSRSRSPETTTTTEAERRRRSRRRRSSEPSTNPKTTAPTTTTPVVTRPPSPPTTTTTTRNLPAVTGATGSLSPAMQRLVDREVGFVLFSDSAKQNQIPTTFKAGSSPAYNRIPLTLELELSGDWLYYVATTNDFVIIVDYVADQFPGGAMYSLTVYKLNADVTSVEYF